MHFGAVLLHLINYGNTASAQIQTYKEIRHLSQGNSLCTSYAFLLFAMKSEISGFVSTDFIARKYKEKLLVYMAIRIVFFFKQLCHRKRLLSLKPNSVFDFKVGRVLFSRAVLGVQLSYVDNPIGIGKLFLMTLVLI